MKTDDRGFALATILVLILVLVVSAFSSALMTRTDTQIVNNKRSSAQAFAIAEAGAAEALMRLGLDAGSNVTVDGTTFDASLKGDFKPNSAWTDWQAEIVFGGVDGPVLTGPTGHTVQTPTIQEAASRLAYSDAAGGQDPLTISWELCTAVGTGCSAVGAIRKIDGSNVLRITSWGRSLPARRMVSLIAVDESGLPGILTSFSNGTGIDMVGNASLEVTGGITVNSVSADAVDGTNNTTIISHGDFNVVGGNENSGTLEPQPTTGSDPIPDPLAALPIPCFQGFTTGCETPPSALTQKFTGRADVPVTKTITSSTTLDPGVYFGGIDISGNVTVTLNPGIYVMAGGGFSLTTGNASLTGTGVMIYNTQTPSAAGQNYSPGGGAFPGRYGPIFLKSSADVTLHAPTSGTWQGIVIFQDRGNIEMVEIQGGTPSDGVLDGIIYAINAPMSLIGGRTLETSFIVGSIRVQGSAAIVPSDITCALATCESGGLQALAWKDF